MNQRLSRPIRAGIILIVVISGLGGIRLAMESLSPNFIYKKDFLAIYLLSLATSRGVNPYLPLSQLADQFQIQNDHAIFSLPTPHPPGLAFFTLPLTVMRYEGAASVWLGFEIFCLLIAATLSARWWNKPQSWWLPIVFLLGALGWRQVSEELMLGQLSTILLACLVMGWQALRNDKQYLGGAVLGLAIAIKIIPWPIVLFLVLRRQWRAAATAAGIILGSNLLAVAVMGWNVVLEYYFRAAPMVASHYRSYYTNRSILSIGWRVFEGTSSLVPFGYQAPPLFNAPQLAPILGYSLVFGVLLCGLWVTRKMPDFDSAFGCMVCVSLLVSPILWSVYFCMLLIPIQITIRNLQSTGYPRRLVFWGILTGFGLLITDLSLAEALERFAVHENGRMGGIVPFGPMLISLLPTALVLSCLFLCALSAKKSDPGKTQSRQPKDAADIEK